MPKLIVLISGNVSAGKTTLSDGLRRQYNATVVKTKGVLKDLAVKKLKRELPSERRALQDFGEQLDTETSGEWVLNALKKHVSDVRAGQEDVVVVDAVRILPQIKYRVSSEEGRRGRRPTRTPPHNELCTYPINSGTLHYRRGGSDQDWRSSRREPSPTLEPAPTSR
jgi:hypothetical protein